MIKVKVNKELIEVPKNFTLSTLLEKMNIGYCAVFINDKQLLMKEYETYKLQENDQIKVIRPLGGG